VSAARPGPSIAVFSTLGSGSHEEDRIVSLTAAPAFDRTVWPFDRASKRRSAARLIRRVRRERPDLVVIEGTSVAAGAVVLVGRFVFGVPYVVSSGDSVGPFIRLIAPKLGPVGYLYELVLCRFSAGFIGWTPYLAGRAMTLGSPRAMTAANWAPPQTTSPTDRTVVRRELGIPEDAVVFGIVGSLNWSDRAGYCYGLELVRAIRRSPRTDVHVVLVGDGSGVPRLEADSGADLGVRIHLTGRVPREQLSRYFSAMDVASLPQSVDCVGAFRYTTKLSEYLAAGLPVVTGQLPFAYDLDGDWLWRLPGDAPWSETYVDALAALMTKLGARELKQRSADVPRDLAIFDEELQRRRATAFLTDVLERTRPRARR
jgi:glycosyltransferase involved in cell wall biosynthesis